MKALLAIVLFVGCEVKDSSMKQINLTPGSKCSWARTADGDTRSGICITPTGVGLLCIRDSRDETITCERKTAAPAECP